MRDVAWKVTVKVGPGGDTAAIAVTDTESRPPLSRTLTGTSPLIGLGRFTDARTVGRSAPTCYPLVTGAATTGLQPRRPVSKPAGKLFKSLSNSHCQRPPGRTPARPVHDARASGSTSKASTGGETREAKRPRNISPARSRENDRACCRVVHKQHPVETREVPPPAPP
jgi:hypothetical protein